MSESPYHDAGGPLSGDSPVYILRDADEKAASHLRRMDYISLIEPRQQGKTSLIHHLTSQFSLQGYTFAFRDMMANKPHVQLPGEWYTSLGKWLLRQLHFIPDGQRPIPPDHCPAWEEFLAGIAEKAESSHLNVVIVLDEIGAVPQSLATDFFSVIRSIYTSRQNLTFWRHLTFIISGAFNPKDLIQNEDISNFNVGKRIPLEDFNLNQLKQLVSYLGLPDAVTEVVAENVLHWTGGQPYLSHQLCTSLLQKKELITISNGADFVADVVQHFFQEDSSHLARIQRLKPELLAYTKRITGYPPTRFNAGLNDRQFHLANIVGVIKASSKGYCQIRNRMYEKALASNEELPVPVSPPIQTQDEYHYDVFICYSHEDAAWVNEVLVSYLKGKNVRICIDTCDFEIGAPSLINMEKAVNHSRKTLLVLTPNWLKTEWTGFESLLFQTRDPLNRGQRLLPILAQNCELPDRLKIFSFLDLTDTKEFDNQMQRLVTAIFSTFEHH